MRFVLLAVLLALLSGFQGAVSQTVTTTVWDLTASASLPGGEQCEFEGTAGIESSGGAMTGTLDLSLVSGAAACPPQAGFSVSGNVAGSDVTGSLQGGPLGDATFTGQLGPGGGTAAGSFTMTNGPFSGTSGSWSAVQRQPALALVKSGSFADENGDGFAQPGETIGYTFDVANTGNVTLTGIAVDDPLPGLSAVTCPGGNPIPSLAPAASETCTATLTLDPASIGSGRIDNTASATGEDPGANPVGASDTASVVLTAAPPPIAVPGLGGAGRLFLILLMLAAAATGLRIALR